MLGALFVFNLKSVADCVDYVALALLPANSNREQNWDYPMPTFPPYSASFLFNRRNNEVG